MQKIVIEQGKYWLCENLDTLAPITEEGICVLLDNGEKVLLNDNYNISDFRLANEQEYKYYYHKLGHIFVGDKIVIVKGRKLPIGSKKIIKSFLNYKIPHTYNKYEKYVVFEDGTKTNIQNVRVIGFENLDYVFEYQRLCISGRI